MPAVAQGGVCVHAESRSAQAARGQSKLRQAAGCKRRRGRWRACGTRPRRPLGPASRGGWGLGPHPPRLSCQTGWQRSAGRLAAEAQHRCPPGPPRPAAAARHRCRCPQTGLSLGPPPLRELGHEGRDQGPQRPGDSRLDTPSTAQCIQPDGRTTGQRLRIPSLCAAGSTAARPSL